MRIIIISVILLAVSIGCSSVQRLGDNKIEGFSNKKMKLTDYSKLSADYKSLRGVMLKVDSINYKGILTDSIYGYHCQKDRFYCYVGLKLGKWGGLKNENLQELIEEEVMFEILASDNHSMDIFNEAKTEVIELYKDLLENNDCYSFSRMGIVKGKNTIIIYNIKDSDDNHVQLFLEDKIIDLRLIDTTIQGQKMKWMTHYVFYNLINGIAFAIDDDDSTVVVPSFENTLSCSEIEAIINNVDDE